ncbi:MAG: GNAT family N-acetyltransferase [Chitinophagales bacterium]
MLTINFDPFPILTTAQLTLRRMTDDDAETVFITRSDPGLMRYIARAPAKSIDEVYPFIRNIDNLISNNESIMWALSLKSDLKFIGIICLWNIQKENHRAEIGFVLLKEHHGTGVMHEAVGAVLDYGFHTMKLHSIAGEVDPENIASIKLMEKNNFRREALFKDHYFYNGKFMDTAIYSIINNE